MSTDRINNAVHYLISGSTGASGIIYRHTSVNSTLQDFPTSTNGTLVDATFLTRRIVKRILVCCFMFFPIIAKAQSAQWTWMNGYSILNGEGIFGTMGVPNANNKPPALWSTFCWTDSNGISWLYGGLKNGSDYAALWKYDPILNVGTLVKGPNTAGQAGEIMDSFVMCICAYVSMDCALI